MPALRRELAACGILGAAFVLFSIAVGAGATRGLDVAVSNFMSRAWEPGLQAPFIALAFLGGIDLTGVLIVGIAAFLWLRTSRADALAVLAFPAAEVLEFIYKREVDHPQPPMRLSHGDAPSLVDAVERSTATANSFPSGHVTRAALVYGLLAFIVWRLAGPGWVRRLAIPIAVAVVALEAFDRLYLGVHWESDVVGALLLGGTSLAAAILWLDRPAPAAA